MTTLLSLGLASSAAAEVDSCGLLKQVVPFMVAAIEQGLTVDEAVASLTGFDENQDTAEKLVAIAYRPDSSPQMFILAVAMSCP